MPTNLKKFMEDVATTYGTNELKSKINTELNENQQNLVRSLFSLHDSGKQKPKEGKFLITRMPTGNTPDVDYGETWGP